MSEPVYLPQQIDAAIQAAGNAHHEIRVMAGVLGVDWRKLIACIIRQVGVVKLVRCLIGLANGGGSIWDCLSGINWEGVISCAGEGVLPPVPPTPPTPVPPTPVPVSGYTPATEPRC